MAELGNIRVRRVSSRSGTMGTMNEARAIGDHPRSLAGAHKMTIDEYAAWAATLGREPLSANKEMLAYLGLGLAGEAGEVADRLKKFLRDGEWDAEGLAEELSDVIYFGRACASSRAKNPRKCSQPAGARSRPGRRSDKKIGRA